MEAAIKQRFDEETYTRGLTYARSLNFTDDQYEEALKRIDRPDNANQLLVALIDVSSLQTPCKPVDGATQESSSLLGQFNDQEAEDLLVENDNKSTGLGARLAVGEFGVADSSSSCSSLTTTTATSSSGISTSQGCGRVGRGASFTSPSTANQSLESLSQQHATRTPLTRTSSSTSTSSCSATGQLTGGCGGGCELKKIYVDGSNVAMTHGKDVAFSWPGIKLCVDWFLARQHHVRVLVPENRCADGAGCGEQARALIGRLDELEVLVRTPSGHNDDLMILEAAHKNQGIIVSNDRYRDERRRRAIASDELDQFVSASRLAYVFVDDLFIPAADPQGRNGPSLDEFLRHEPWSHLSNGKGPPRQHAKLGKSRSHQMPRQGCGGGGGGGGGGSRSNHLRAYNTVYRHPQQSIMHVHAGHQPDYTSSRQIHSWQGPARPSLDSTQPAFDYKQYPPVARGPCFAPPADNSRHPQQQQQSPNSKLAGQTSIWPAFLRR